MPKYLLSNIINFYFVFICYYFFLEPYSTNKIKSLVKKPRLHFVDSGLCCFLLGIESVEDFLMYSKKGNIFESYVVFEFIKIARNNGDYANFYFYREELKNSENKGGLAEIDLIKEKSGVLYPIEIKMNASFKIEMVKWFSRLNGNNVGMGTLVTLSDKKTLLNSKTIILPCSMI